MHYGSIHFKGTKAEKKNIPGINYSYENGWVTLTSEDYDYGSTDFQAQKLSKEIPQPVLSVEYFDGDFVSFTIYQNGKKVNCHIPSDFEGMSAAPGSSSKFAKAFGLSKTEKKYLDVIFREDNADKSVALMESLLRCPIQSIQGKSAPSTELTIEYAKSYVEEWEKLSSKVKCTLIFNEMKNISDLGDFMFLTSEPDGHQAVWKYCSNNTLTKFIDLPPGKFNNFFDMNFGTFAIDTILSPTINFGLIRGEDDFDELIFYSDNGVLIDRIKLIEIDNNGLDYSTKIILWDESHLLICCTHYQTYYGKIIRYDFKNHKIDWKQKIPFESKPPRLYLIDSKIFLLCPTDERGDVLLIINKDGMMQEKEFGNSEPKIVNNCIYSIGFEKQVCCLSCYNSNLELLYQIPLTKNFISSWGITLLQNTQLFLHGAEEPNGYKKLYHIDLLGTPSVKKFKSNEEIWRIIGAIPGIGVVCLTRINEISIYDFETLERISIQKLKGRAFQSKQTPDGKFLILAAEYPDWDNYSKEEPFIKIPGHVWIYQLEANLDAQT